MIVGLRAWFLVGMLCTTLPWVATARAVDAPNVPALIAAAQAGDEAARTKAIDQLGDQGAKAAAAVGPLSQLLSDKSATVRAHAAHALGKLGKASLPAVPALAGLTKDNDDSVRRQAVKALVAIHPGPQVMMPIMVKLLEDADPALRVRILHAVAQAGPSALPGMILALKNEKAAYWACLVLREMGPVAKEAVPSLAEALKATSPEVRREAALTLGGLGEAASAAVPQLVAALDDADSRVAATFALGQIGQVPKEAEAKILANAKEGDKFLSTVSYWTLSRVHPDDKELRKEAAERIVERLMDKDPYVRLAAARALAALPPAPEITLPIIEKALKDSDEETVHHALDALAALGPKAVPRLIDALKHEKIRPQVLYVLGQIGADAAPAAEPLAKFLSDDNPKVVNEAALTLSKIGPSAQNAVPALVAALQKGEPDEVTGLIYALGKIGGSGAAAAEPKLVELLKSDDASIAVLSGWALTQINPKSSKLAFQTFPVLYNGLSNPLPACRHTAAEALGKLGHIARNAVPALEKATQDKDPAVRETAAEAIRQIRAAALK